MGEEIEPRVGGAAVTFEGEGTAPLTQSEAKWEGLGVGGAHQWRECRQVRWDSHCCIQVSLGWVVINNALFVRCLVESTPVSTIACCYVSSQRAVVGYYPLPTSATSCGRR